MLDVLGWRGIYNREEDPIAILERLVRTLRADELHRGLPFETEVRSISDTIVLFSKVGETGAVRAIEAHGAICAHGITESISCRIPLRGATSYGEFDVRENIYVGRAIDEAAAWHEMGEWVGVHLTPSANYVVDANLSNWVPYEPPLKQMRRCPTHCVDWTKRWRESASDGDPLRKLKSVFRAMGPILPEIAPKFANTIAFAEERYNIVETSDGIPAV